MVSRGLARTGAARLAAAWLGKAGWAGAGLGMVLLLASPAGAEAPGPPQIIADGAYRPVAVPEIIRDRLPLPTPGPRVAWTSPEAPVVVPIVSPAPSRKLREPVTSGVPSVADAKGYALSVLGPTQYSCLDQIAIHESHWNPYDLNKSSGAYGIPQALPGSKMAVIADDWHDNPITQVRWMIRYVNGRYGSACAAWSFWVDNRWY